MANDQFAWVTRAPADYTMLFRAEPGGEHAVVSGLFEGREQARRACEDLGGGAVEDGKLDVYCTLPGEPERALTRLGERTERTSIVHGDVNFVAIGGGRDLSESRGDRAAGAGNRGGKAESRIIVGLGGDAPRCYRFERQCSTCGELLGRINVLPAGGAMVDTRELSCRCASIACRYCEHGRVRRPHTEHLDPERRAGRMPWFGYLVPCGGCQAAARGPRVVMSA